MEVVDFLVDPLRSGIDRRALLELALVGGFCGALGFWVVTERLAYSAESLSHGLLPGLVLAALAGAPLLLGAAGGALVAAALIAFAARDARIGPDAGTAVAVTGLVGLGALLALAPDSPQRLEELLFGDPLGVTDGDLIAAGLLLTFGGAALVGPPPPAVGCGLRRRGRSRRGPAPGSDAARPARAARRRGGRGGPGTRDAAGARRADRPPARREATRRYAGPRDVERRGGGRARGDRGHRSLIPRAQRGRRDRGARPLRGGCARKCAQAVAGRHTVRRVARIPAPSASIPRAMSCAWVRPTTTSSLRRMNSIRKRSIPAIMR